MRWFAWPAWLHLFSRVQEERERQAELLRHEPDEPLPGSDLSVEERRKELEREAQRRSERRAR